jgi:cytidylate kinase
MAVITISRQYGSGGSEVAQRVASTLGWELLDNAIVDAVAARLDMSSEEVEAREERVPSLVERLASAMSLGSPEMLITGEHPLGAPSEEQIVATTAQIVDEAVSRGNVVLVGRGAQSQLAERDDALHVFCYAPRAALIARAARRLGVTEAEAMRVVDDTNRAREQYVRRHWNRAWQGVDNYHLCVNTSWLGIEGAADMISRAAKEHFG